MRTSDSKNVDRLFTKFEEMEMPNKTLRDLRGFLGFFEALQILSRKMLRTLSNYKNIKKQPPYRYCMLFKNSELNFL